MALFDRFPWVNTHELNLNWIIQKMKEWGKESAENVAAARTAAENAATNAANAVVGVAERAEAAADRAETAKTAAETAKTAAETAKTGAETAKTEAITAKTSAESNASKAGKAFKAASLSADGSAASAAEASRIESIVRGYAEDCNSASASALASANAAAASAEEAAQAAAGFPYYNYDRGYAYKTIDTTDTRTGNSKEYIQSPNLTNEMFRVSGAVFPTIGPIVDNNVFTWHYEKIYKIDLTSGVEDIDITSDTVEKNLKPSRIESLCMYSFDPDDSKVLGNLPYITTVKGSGSGNVVNGSIYYNEQTKRLGMYNIALDVHVAVYIRVYFTESGVG